MKILCAYLSLMCGPAHQIEAGWYQRADSRASGGGGITSWNMALGETGVRCMCNDDGHGNSGFWVTDNDDGTFTVARAPEGYSDTIGRSFKTRELK